MGNFGITRRAFLGTAAATTTSIALPSSAWASASQLGKPIKIGLIADLHQDIMHDGPDRLDSFLESMKLERPDAIMQLGDFAYPNADNQFLIDRFNQAHETSLHVIGNHDTDNGHTKQQCLDNWGMPARYYAKEIDGLWLLVLDGNDKGSPTHQGGYPSYVGEEQLVWLKEQLEKLEGPIIIVSHQPLAGSAAVDNAADIQELLGHSADKILLAINGHTHIDDVLRVNQVTYYHVNSAAYKWVGGDYQHQSYSSEIHTQYPWIAYTCPYQDSLFATMTVDPIALTIDIKGRTSEWVGDSPAQIGAEGDAQLIHGEDIAPRIRDRHLARVTKS